MMLEEDLNISDKIKSDLVFQREELESYYEQIKSENDDINIVCDILSK